MGGLPGLPGQTVLLGVVVVNKKDTGCATIHLPADMQHLGDLHVLEQGLRKLLAQKYVQLMERRAPTTMVWWTDRGRAGHPGQLAVQTVFTIREDLAPVLPPPMEDFTVGART